MKMARVHRPNNTSVLQYSPCYPIFLPLGPLLILFCKGRTVQLRGREKYRVRSYVNRRRVGPFRAHCRHEHIAGGQVHRREA
jgi:hypothetical protein